MSKLRLEGKVAIITGAASGIGETSAELFVANGAIVVIADIQDELGQRVTHRINVSSAFKGEDRCTYRHCDVTDEKQVQDTVDYTIATYGRLDIVYSNAGILGSPTTIADLDLAELNRIMTVNVGGALAMIKHGARAMIAKGVRGSILCTASVAAQRAGLGPVAYTTSKHALLGLVRAAAGEYGPYGIRVNCVSPFGVATPLSCGLDGVSPDVVESIVESVATLKGVKLKTYHVAEAALFLVSDQSAYISGHDLVVDGATTTCSSSKFGMSSDVA